MEIYNKVVEPYIKSNYNINIDWIYNILDKKAAVDRNVYEDNDPENGFIIVVNHYTRNINDP